MATPSINWKFFLDLAVRVLGPLLALVSDELRELLEDFAVKFYTKAKGTDNPWDDFFAMVLLKVLGIPEPKE
jgi:hypothetical protein